MNPQKITKDAPNFGQMGEISPNLVTLIPSERKSFYCQKQESHQAELKTVNKQSREKKRGCT